MGFETVNGLDYNIVGTAQQERLAREAIAACSYDWKRLMAYGLRVAIEFVSADELYGGWLGGHTQGDYGQILDPAGGSHSASSAPAQRPSGPLLGGELGDYGACTVGTAPPFAGSELIVISILETLDTDHAPFGGRRFFYETLIRCLGWGVTWAWGANGVTRDEFARLFQPADRRAVPDSEPRAWETNQWWYESIGRDHDFPQLGSVNELGNPITNPRPPKTWGQPAPEQVTLPWEHRLIEGAAEAFKDLFLPRQMRRFKNRTAVRLKYGRDSALEAWYNELLPVPLTDVFFRGDGFFAWPDLRPDPTNTFLIVVGENYHWNTLIWPLGIPFAIDAPLTIEFDPGDPNDPSLDPWLPPAPWLPRERPSSVEWEMSLFTETGGRANPMQWAYSHIRGDFMPAHMQIDAAGRDLMRNDRVYLELTGTGYIPLTSGPGPAELARKEQALQQPRPVVWGVWNSFDQWTDLWYRLRFRMRTSALPKLPSAALNAAGHDQGTRLRTRPITGRGTADAGTLPANPQWAKGAEELYVPDVTHVGHDQGAPHEAPR